MNGIGVEGTSSQDTLEAENAKELKKCDIKVSITLENLSKNFSPMVLQTLEQQQGKKFEKTIEFFVPDQHRSFKDEENNSAKIASLTTDLEEWVEDYFGFLLVSGYVDKVVQHAISHIFWVCPFHSVDSLEFKTLSCFVIVGAILEDWVGSSKTTNYDGDGLKPNANCKGYRNRMEVFEYLKSLLKMGDTGSQDLTEKLKSSKSSTMEIMNKEPIVAALYDGLMDIYEMTKQVQPDLIRRNYFSAFRVTAMGCFEGFQWSRDKTGNKCEDDYSVDTCRYFQQLEGTIEGYSAMLGLLEGYDLSQEVKGHVVFLKWNDLAAKIVVIQKDVLGFQRNVGDGKEGGILMKKIRSGLSVPVAVDEEMNLLSEFTSDYVNLRGILLMKFKENKKVERYIDVVDSWLYGNFQTFIGSLEYGMKDNIVIIHR